MTTAESVLDRPKESELSVKSALSEFGFRAGNDTDLKNIPEADEEMERKYGIHTQNDLHNIYLGLITSGNISHAFYKHPPEPWFKKDIKLKGLVYTHPVSAYLDTNKRDLSKNGGTLRVRFTADSPDLTQISIKGFAQSINGHGSAIRHEKEKFIGNNPLTTSIFTDKKSRSIIDSIKDQPLYYYFATNVPRTVSPIEVIDNNQNKMIFEVSFDYLNYVKPTWNNRSLSRSFNDYSDPKLHNVFAQKAEIEIEYFNPLSHPKFAKKQDLPLLDKEQIRNGQEVVLTTLQAIALQYGITLEQHNFSKGKYGFNKMQRVYGDKTAEELHLPRVDITH